VSMGMWHSAKRPHKGSHLYLDTRLAVCPVCVYTMMSEAPTLSAARTADDAIDSCKWAATVFGISRKEAGLIDPVVIVSALCTTQTHTPQRFHAARWSQPCASGTSPRGMAAAPGNAKACHGAHLARQEGRPLLEHVAHGAEVDARAHVAQRACGHILYTLVHPSRMVTKTATTLMQSAPCPVVSGTQRLWGEASLCPPGL